MSDKKRNAFTKIKNKKHEKRSYWMDLPPTDVYTYNHSESFKNKSIRERRNKHIKWMKGKKYRKRNNNKKTSKIKQWVNLKQSSRDFIPVKTIINIDHKYMCVFLCSITTIFWFDIFCGLTKINKVNLEYSKND